MAKKDKKDKKERSSSCPDPDGSGAAMHRCRLSMTGAPVTPPRDGDPRGCLAARTGANGASRDAARQTADTQAGMSAMRTPLDRRPVKAPAATFRCHDGDR